MKRTLIVLLIVFLLSFPTVPLAGLCGDVNNDNELNLSDITYLINYLYRDGLDLNCPTDFNECGDVDGNDKVNLFDVSLMINQIYRDGPELDCGKGTVIDIDGNIYKTIRIGDQWWMTENLRVTHYRNGDSIPNITVDDTWQELASGAYCNYGNDSNNAAVYGHLYNWYAVNDTRNIAPAGWHVPYDFELQAMVDYLGGDAVAGGKLKDTGLAHWYWPNTAATNASGFSARPGGFRYGGGTYGGINYYAYFWSFMEPFSYFATPRRLAYNSGKVTVIEMTSILCDGYSIRCIKN